MLGYFSLTTELLQQIVSKRYRDLLETELIRVLNIPWLRVVDDWLR